MTLRGWLLAVGIGCPAPTDVASPTADSADPEPQAGCELSENALRVECAITLAQPGSVTLVMTAAGVPSREFSSPESRSEHHVTAWGLVPETTYSWSMGDSAGTITTGALPKALQSAAITVQGTSSGFDAVLHPLECGNQGYFTLIDGLGRILWYEENDVYFRGGMSGYEWSQDTRSILSVTGQTFLEQDVYGQELLRLQAPYDFTQTLHHDTDRWGNYRYLLFEHRFASVNVDGIHVHDGAEIVGTFHLEDHFQVTPGASADWAHANGLNVTDEGVIVLSLLNFDAVLGIDGDPASATFLEVLWHAGGTPTSGLPGAGYHGLSGENQGFERQHNASRFGDTLWVFDNRSQPVSRALRMRMNHTTGALPVTGAWSFDDACPNQGGALPVPGGVLATCANAGHVWLFDEGESEPVWKLRAACGEAGRVRVTRAIPVDLR